MNPFKEEELYQKCVAIWKSCKQIIHLEAAKKYTDLSIKQLIKEMNILEEEQEDFRTRFLLHLLTEELPDISQSEIKTLV